MESYEALIAFNPQIGKEKVEELLNKFSDKLKSAGAEIEKKEELGRKQLPFKLQAHKELKEVFYALLSFKGETSLPKLLTDNFRITEEVVRFLVTKTSGAKLLEIEGAPVEEKTEISSSVLLDLEPKPQ
ncbi:MAG: 30S ribosomal protein S6 [Candidatus Saganbacteria bacterium]|nr:30S ribosomal protein S6 [Candidatus Saganbacteria bacterium]